MSIIESHGEIELIIGPMFAGKTTELMRRVRRELFALRTCYVIKHARDNRYSAESVSSHDKMLLAATAAVSELKSIGGAWRSYDVVAVDEGQFFPDIVEFCTEAADAGKKVLVSALDGDYRRQPFDGICRLIPLAESVKKLTAVCMACNARPASFTYRTVRSNKRELIGGADMYIAACRTCYVKKEREDNLRQKQEEEEIAAEETPLAASQPQSQSPSDKEAARNHKVETEKTEEPQLKKNRTEVS